MAKPAKKLMDQREAAKEGAKFHAFMLGRKDAKRGIRTCPFATGTDAARHWEAGQAWHEMELQP